MDLSYWQLVSGDDINVPGIGTIVPPHLSDLRIKSGVGYDKYLQYINTFVLDIREQAIDIPEMRELCSKMDYILKRDFTTYDFYLINEVLTTRLIEAVSFFIKEEVQLRPEDGVLIVLNGEKVVGAISHENYKTLSGVICKVCYLDVEHEEVPKNKSKHFLDIWFKRREGRKAMRKSGDKDLSIENIVSAIVARHHSYNFSNIWDLTIFQLYDIFKHMHTNEITDRLRMRWAMGLSKDDWENDKLWYAPNNKS